jgi:cholesterol oxidase
MSDRHDFVIIGSGFGGSVSALRLAEKGYRVLVVERGRRWAPEDFPRNNMDVKRWLWMPKLGCHGFFKMSFFKHVTALHGVGVGGGSLVYANVMPMPMDGFFTSEPWASLADWRAELAPHYVTARRMLGIATNPRLSPADHALASIADDLGRGVHLRPVEAAVYFGDPGKTVPDPYFDGDGPDRTGCTFCGACITGCRVGAKNTLDRNYLYLAEKRSAEVQAETEVTAVRPIPGGGYAVEATTPRGPVVFKTDRVIFAGGVMGTVPLLLAMRDDAQGLPKLSPRVGDFVRSNCEVLMGVLSLDPDQDFSKGISITSLLETDEYSSIEPIRFGSGSDFFRPLSFPHASAPTTIGRMVGALRAATANPARWAHALTVPQFARGVTVLMYMRTIDEGVSLRLGRSLLTGYRKGVVSVRSDALAPPAATMPEADDLARRFSEKVKGVRVTLLSEMLIGAPTTAHIMGGSRMGRDASEGVIDDRHRVFGYDGLYVVDGSTMSANPGVNPSLTISALAERAMSFIPQRGTGGARATTAQRST